MSPMIDRFPGIKVVALKIAYDNGMINCTQTEEEWLVSLDSVLGAEGVYEKDLKKVSEWCLTLSDEEQETLAAGEHEEMTALQQKFSEPDLLGIFDDIFNGENV